jgi:hypothetical protein
VLGLLTVDAGSEDLLADDGRPNVAELGYELLEEIGLASELSQGDDVGVNARSEEELLLTVDGNSSVVERLADDSPWVLLEKALTATRELLTSDSGTSKPSWRAARS